MGLLGTISVEPGSEARYAGVAIVPEQLRLDREGQRNCFPHFHVGYIEPDAPIRLSDIEQHAAPLRAPFEESPRQTGEGSGFSPSGISLGLGAVVCGQRFFAALILTTLAPLASPSK